MTTASLPSLQAAAEVKSGGSPPYARLCPGGGESFDYLDIVSTKHIP